MAAVPLVNALPTGVLLAELDIFDPDDIELAATAYRRDVDVQRRRLAGYEAQIIGYGDLIAPPVHGRLNLASREGRGNFPTRP